MSNPHRHPPQPAGQPPRRSHLGAGNQVLVLDQGERASILNRCVSNSLPSHRFAGPKPTPASPVCGATSTAPWTSMVRSSTSTPPRGVTTQQRNASSTAPMSLMSPEVQVIENAEPVGRDGSERSDRRLDLVGCRAVLRDRDRGLHHRLLSHHLGHVHGGLPRETWVPDHPTPFTRSAHLRVRAQQPKMVVGGGSPTRASARVGVKSSQAAVANETRRSEWVGTDRTG